MLVDLAIKLWFLIHLREIFKIIIILLKIIKQYLIKYLNLFS